MLLRRTMMTMLMMIVMLTAMMMMIKPIMASLAAPERWKPPMTAWILNLLGNHYVDSGDDVDVDDGDDDECTRQRKGGRNRGNGFITELGSHWVTLAVTHRGVAILVNMLSTSVHFCSTISKGHFWPPEFPDPLRQHTGDWAYCDNIIVPHEKFLPQVLF